MPVDTEKQTNKFYSTVAYKGWFLLQKYFVLFCSKSFSYEWTCYSYYLLSDTSWKKGNIQDALFLMVEKFLICSGVFFFVLFPSPRREAPVLFRTQGLQTRTLRVCWSETLTHTHTRAQVVWCVAEGVLWHVKAGAPGWRWNCSLFSEPLCLQRLWAAVVYHTFW